MAAVIEPIKLINALNKADMYIEIIFTQGSCYQFHVFLKKIYKNCTPYISKSKGHIISKIGNEFYDIRGTVSNEGYTPMTIKEIIKARKWSFYKNNFLTGGQCIDCGEPLIFERQDDIPF